jgi:hypothetical protein
MKNKEKAGKTVQEVVAKKLKDANEILKKGNFLEFYESRKNA